MIQEDSPASASWELGLDTDARQCIFIGVTHSPFDLETPCCSLSLSRQSHARVRPSRNMVRTLGNHIKKIKKKKKMGKKLLLHSDLD